LSTGEVSPATEAMSLQGRPKVGLIIHCQELNAYVLSAGTILFVQNQNNRITDLSFEEWILFIFVLARASTRGHR
ncbi:MAG: hypothetical protein AAF827_10590, partial [Cyanobacteria bacterium P01_D01_bin.6]